MQSRTKFLVTILGLVALLLAGSVAIAKPIMQIYLVQSTVVLFENGFVEVKCAEGDTVTGGGFHTGGGRFQNVLQNWPASRSSWIVAISIGPDDDRPITLTGFALCAR